MKEVNILLDISGSMPLNDFQKAFDKIFDSHEVAHLIQFDSEVRNVGKIYKSDLKFKQSSGGYGTFLQPGLDYITNNKDLSKLDTFIVSDGFTEKCTFLEYSKNIIHIKPPNSIDLDISLSQKTSYNTIELY